MIVACQYGIINVLKTISNFSLSLIFLCHCNFLSHFCNVTVLLTLMSQFAYHSFSSIIEQTIFFFFWFCAKMKIRLGWFFKQDMERIRMVFQAMPKMKKWVAEGRDGWVDLCQGDWFSLEQGPEMKIEMSSDNFVRWRWRSN